MTPREIDNLIIDLFEEFPEVNSIRRSDTFNGVNVWIFLATKKYDDSLMDELLECEILVTKEYPEEAFDFRYVPLAICGDPKDATDVFSVEIYHR